MGEIFPFRHWCMVGSNRYCIHCCECTTLCLQKRPAAFCT